jgi:hypothetical protein
MEGERRSRSTHSKPRRWESVFITILRPLCSRCSFYKRLGGGRVPRGMYGLVQETSPPLGLELRTFQCVANRYTDNAIRPPMLFVVLQINRHPVEGVIKLLVERHMDFYIWRCLSSTSTLDETWPAVLRKYIHGVVINTSH